MTITMALTIVEAVGSLLSTLKGTKDVIKQKNEELLTSNFRRFQSEHDALPQKYLDALEGKSILTQAMQSLQ